MGGGDRAVAALSVAIRVTPSASRTAVGGARGEALVIRVTEAAVDGRATKAALDALAAALGIPRRRVRLRRGASSRDKVVEIALDPVDSAGVEARLRKLRGESRT